MNLPTKSHIATLDPFQGLGIASVMVISGKREAANACRELLQEEFVGFDTESKPIFRKGEESDGPHLLQFATMEKAYLFPSHIAEASDHIIELLTCEKLVKVGFDLKGDLRQISHKYGVRAATTMDLGHSFRKLGHRNTIGATSAIAMLFNRRLHKSKSITTSNWAARKLTDRQLLYAANDAYAAILVFHALRKLEMERANPDHDPIH